MLRKVAGTSGHIAVLQLLTPCPGVDSQSATAPIMQVVCSRDVKVAGLLSKAASLEAKSSAAAEHQVGFGGITNQCLAHRLFQNIHATTAAVFQMVCSKQCS